MNATPYNLRLTIENTETLYKQALAVKDLSLEGDDITSLMANTLVQIEKDSGEPANTSDVESEFTHQIGTVLLTVEMLQELER